MKLTVNPITNGSGQVEIHSRIQKLQIFFSALIANYATGQALLTALGNSILIEVTRQSKQGTKTMIYSVNVLTLMEIASANEGAVRCFKDATKSYVIGTVELADEGAVQFGKNDFITVKIQAVPNNVNLDLFAIDSDHETRTVNHYEQIHINANAPKDIEVHNTRWL